MQFSQETKLSCVRAILNRCAVLLAALWGLAGLSLGPAPADAGTAWRQTGSAPGGSALLGIEDGGAALGLSCGSSSSGGGLSATLVLSELDDREEALRLPVLYRVDGAAPRRARLAARSPGAGAKGIDGEHYDLIFERSDWFGTDLLVFQVPTVGRRLAFDLAAAAPHFSGLSGACGIVWPPTNTDAHRARVRDIQAALSAHGFDPGRQDGVFDLPTTAAIEAFQSYQGTLVDGAPTEALRAHLAETPASGLSHAQMTAFAAQIEAKWSVPSSAKGIYHMVVPLRLSIAADGAITKATADPRLIESDRPMARRLAYSAEDAAHALGRFEDAAAVAVGRELTINVRPPIGPTYKIYARKLAQRIAFYANIPESFDRDDGLIVRLHIDGSAHSIQSEILRGDGADAPSAQAVFRFIDSMPRIPQVPVEGMPKLFTMDVTLFPRDPFVLDGWVAYPDWPVP